MKVKQLNTKGTTAPKSMPADLRTQLNGLTINEALERGIIDDLGDANGNFTFQHADDNIDKTYALIQGYAVGCSKNLGDVIADSNDVLGDLQFSKGISNIEGDGFGKEYFVLGLPAGIRLGAVVSKLNVEPVQA